MTRLKAAILEQGLTQRELAQMINQSPSSISQVINGFMRPWPKLRREIAEALHIPENELFDEKGNLIESDAEYIKIPLKKYA